MNFIEGSPEPSVDEMPVIAAGEIESAESELNKHTME
jgi:hypothetical protein